jgi:hypothetical protein
MDETKFLLALQILHDANNAENGVEYSQGYSRALYDVLQASKLCK